MSDKLAGIAFGTLAALVLLLLSYAAISRAEYQAVEIEAQTKSNSAFEHQKAAGGISPKLGEPSATGNSESARKTGESQEEASEFWPTFIGHRLKITDTLLVLFTAVLAWKTWGLDSGTRGLQAAALRAEASTLQALQIANDTAEAAKRSADAAIRQTENAKTIEFPVVVATNYTFDSKEPMDAEAIPTNCVFHTLVKNFGRTPAEIISSWLQVSFDCPFGKGGTAEPEYFAKWDYPPGTFLTPGNNVDLMKDFIITNENKKEIIDEARHIWAHGYIAFRDYLGGSHETRFCVMCLRYGPMHDRKTVYDFVVHGDTPAAYLLRT